MVSAGPQTTSESQTAWPVDARHQNFNLYSYSVSLYILLFVPFTFFGCVSLSPYTHIQTENRVRTSKKKRNDGRRRISFVEICVFYANASRIDRDRMETIDVNYLLRENVINDPSALTNNQDVVFFHQKRKSRIKKKRHNELKSVALINRTNNLTNRIFRLYIARRADVSSMMYNTHTRASFSVRFAVSIFFASTL